MAVEFRILDTNECFESDTVITQSSEDVNFPSSNLAIQTRAKTWRSSGNYVIDSTNNAIDFDEGGAELNATIASATYTAATLATAVDTAMDAVGTSDYTTTYSSSTGKFTITQDTPGTFNLLWSSGTNTATAADAVLGFATVDETGATAYTSDVVSLHTEETVTFDFVSATNIDSVSVVFDPIVGNTLSGSATLQIQANATDSWASPSVSQTLTIDTDHLVATHFFASDQNFRYWRLRIVDTANSNLYVEIPLVILSNHTALTRNPEIGFVYKLRDQSIIQRTPYGHLYADNLPQLKGLEFNYKAMDFTDMETIADIYAAKGTKNALAIALDTAEDLFDKDRFFVYGTFAGEFRVNHVARDFFDHAFRLEEII